MPRNTRKKLVVCLMIMLISSGVYYSRELDLGEKLPALIFEKQTAGISAAISKTNADQPENQESKSRQTLSDNENQQKSGSTPINPGKSNDANLETELEQKAGQPIAKMDILKVSLVLIRKLSPEDIQYLRQAAQKDAYTREDYERSREIINKLSVEDISMLKEIGKKYGKDLKFINQS